MWKCLKYVEVCGRLEGLDIVRYDLDASKCNQYISRWGSEFPEVCGNCFHYQIKVMASSIFQEVEEKLLNFASV